MKKFLPLLVAAFSVASTAYAQNFEVTAGVYSGLFRYAGKDATSSSYINRSFGSSPDYTNNPYGKKNGFCYGGNVQVQLVAKTGFILGLQTGLEALRSKVAITAVTPPPSNEFSIAALAPFPAKGNTILRNINFNLNPYIGYRLKLKTTSLDLMPGLDVGFNLNSHENGSAKLDDGTEAKTNLKRSDAPTDVRLRFGVASTCKRLMFTVSYAHGLTNYQKYALADAPVEVHSELLRFGIAYRIL